MKPRVVRPGGKHGAPDLLFPGAGVRAHFGKVGFCLPLIPGQQASGARPTLRMDPCLLPVSFLSRGLLVAVALLLPGLARAQEGGMGVMACFADLPPEEFAGRFEAYADSVGFDARMAELCARGDDAGARALAAAVEAGFLRADPVAASVRQCLAGITAATGNGASEVCDAVGG